MDAKEILSKLTYAAEDINNTVALFNSLTVEERFSLAVKMREVGAMLCQTRAWFVPRLIEPVKIFFPSQNEGLSILKRLFELDLGFYTGRYHLGKEVPKGRMDGVIISKEGFLATIPCSKKEVDFKQHPNKLIKIYDLEQFLILNN